jgi:hypothetical protein
MSPMSRLILPLTTQYSTSASRAVRPKACARLRARRVRGFLHHDQPVARFAVGLVFVAHLLVQPEGQAARPMVDGQARRFATAGPAWAARQVGQQALQPLQHRRAA